MKILSVKPYAFQAGFRNVCLVKIETDEGIYGWGESGLSGREKAVVGAIQHFASFLVGQDPRNINALWQEMYRSQYFEGGRVLTAAISAIDIALYDVLGKYLDVPVYQLLGGKQRHSIPLFVTSTQPLDERFIDHALNLKAQGWKVIRATTGEHGSATQGSRFEPRESIAKAAACLTQARELLGRDVTLGIDYHHRLTVAETVSFIKRMPVGTLDFIEEPIRAESPTSYATLRQMCDVPFAIGEEFASKWDFAPYVESGLTQFGRIDVCNVGGFTEAMKVAAMCEVKYIDMMPHNPLSPICSAASVHYCAAINNMAWLELPPYEGELDDFDKFFIGRPLVENHAHPVNDRPGLGVDVIEEAVIDASFQDWEAPRLYRDDGSYTNW